MENMEIIPLNWSGIEIEVIFERSYSEIYEKIYGYALSHIETRSVRPHHAPLPITDTGFRSIFMTEPEVLKHGGEVSLVLYCLKKGRRVRHGQRRMKKPNSINCFDGKAHLL